MRAISRYNPSGGLYYGGFFALRVWWAGHIFGGAYTWRGLFSEFYGTSTVCTLQHGLHFPCDMLAIHPLKIDFKTSFLLEVACA